MQISDLADWIRDLEEPSVAPLLAGLQHLLDSFAEIGLATSPSSAVGDAVRGRGTAHQDDPPPWLIAHRRDLRVRRATIGLHPHDIERMNDLLLQPRDKGNTVLVVEHKPR